MYTLKLPTDDELIGLDEWHGGRTAFGLWYVPIADKTAATAQKMRALFKDVLAPNYERTFHITLFVVGFCGEDAFNQANLHRQIKVLQDLKLTPFKLSLSTLGSFDNSLHIKIGACAVLDEIRCALQRTHQEISPADYVPHITLGFYQDRYLMADILSKIQAVSLVPETFLVDRLNFGTYVPTQPQGKLSCEYQLLLGA